LAELNLPGIRD